ncbi:MAG: hypothetical protein MUC47_00605 [Candidatus Kapabacteria bacterium]|jgi:uncharacterized membrane protein|nr:hypothetical protein [Candidatus Kapabacteria bacterium]
MTVPDLVLVVSHALAGTVALAVGTAITMLPKGTPLHRRLGNVFVWAMLAVGLSGITMAILRPNSFLMNMGIFSAAMAWSGRRIMKHRTSRVYVDVALAIILVGVSLALYGMAMAGTAVVIPVVFATAILIMAVTELRVALQRRQGPLPRATVLARHIGLMGGALIASWTAFIVVNGVVPWPIVGWIGPSVIGTAIITHAIRRRVAKA